MFPAQQKLRQRVQDTISDIVGEPEQIDSIAKIRDHYRIEDDGIYYPTVQEYMRRDIELPEAMDRLFIWILGGIRRFNQSEIKFFDLWHSILHSAMRTPFQDAASHDRLVEFVGQYQKEPHPSGMHDAYGPGRGGIFGSLWGYSYTVQSYWNDVPGHGSGPTEPEIHAWANLNHFWACLTKSEICDHFRECLSAMRGALEYEMKNKRSFQEFTAVQLYNSLVPAAAVWVFVLRGKLYEKEQDLTQLRYSKAPNYAYGGDLYKGPSGFNKGRWRLWKGRFSVISQMQFLSKETRDLAKQAFDIMELDEPTVPEARYALRPRKKLSA
jgi:hypothetical protein